MANIKYLTKSKRNPSSLYVRFYKGRTFDITSNTGYLIDPKYWSLKQQRITTGASSAFEASAINPQLVLLKEFIVKSYNENYANGGVFNKDWLDGVIARFNNRPKDELSNYEIYFVPFVQKHIEESKTRINPNSGKIISPRTIQKYETTLTRLKEFQDREKIILKIWDIDLSFHRTFLSFLKIEGNYGGTTISKYLDQIKSFCREAKTMGLKVSPEFEHRNFTARRDKPIDVYLNEKEIGRIFNADFSKNIRLNNVRQLMLIGLWTGLRISDLKRIHDYSFTDNKIQIVDSYKTGGYINIPIHPHIKAVLAENDGELPRVISDAKFNLYVKEICKEVGIDKVVMGSKMNPETKRKEKGYYPKYELISSHTCRRSFATNLYGNLPNQTIMAITNHKSEQQFIKYIKTTQEEHVEKLTELWSNNN
jgi:integrase